MPVVLANFRRQSSALTPLTCNVTHMNLQERIDDLLKTTGWSATKLATVAGVSRSAVYQWQGKTSTPVQSIKLAHALAIQDASGVSAQWIAEGIGQKFVDQAQPGATKTPREGDAYKPAIKAHKIQRSTPWEDLVRMDSIDGELRTVAPDDALAPRLRRGQVVVLDGSAAPETGDGVLVADKVGGRHLRIYRQLVGRWEAVPTNDSYPTLDSERDGLRVIAVIVGVLARWC